VAAITQDIPGALQDAFPSYEDAVALYTAAFGIGHVHRVVEVDGIHDQNIAATPLIYQRRQSAESSIWGRVSYINNIAAEWEG